MCGIVGIIGSNQASQNAVLALQMLQHRGQDSAGILTADANTGKFHLHKALGHVSQVFNRERTESLKGNIAIGHTRYSTIGEVREADLQPMALSLPVGIGMVHNGNVSNYEDLKKSSNSKRRTLMSDNDLEIILHTMAEHYSKNSKEGNDGHSTFSFQALCTSVEAVMSVTKGGFSVVGAFGSEGIFAFRDPHGIRPLILGKRLEDDGTTGYALASETCALKFLGYEIVRDVQAGELIYISQSREIVTAKIRPEKPLPCMFEWVYFSSADSTFENLNVYEARLRLGHLLAKRIPADLKIDVVAPVPDTSRPAAIGLAEKRGVPFREILIKNRYVQRSFILNGQDVRKLAVKMKFSVVDELVRGKNILLVDDSIVRGTTSKKLIELLKSHGAKNVYLASTCPPIHHPCFYGIDFPSPTELVAHNKDQKQIAATLGADAVYFTTLDDLKEALEDKTYCQACLNGEYAYGERA